MNNMKSQTLNSRAQQLRNDLHLMLDSNAYRFEDETHRVLVKLINSSISIVEELEQTVIALTNEQPTEKEINYLNEKLECAMIRYNELADTAKIIQVERNTLNEVIRIFASRGRINPSNEIGEDYGRVGSAEITS